MKLTIEYFEKLGACDSGKKWYLKNYPDGLTASELLKKIKPENIDWYVWLLGNSIACVKVNGVDVHAKDNVGGTPLHWAASYGHKDVAELLINKGADVNAKDDLGGTPLHFATSNGYKDVAELLINNGAK